MELVSRPWWWERVPSPVLDAAVAAVTAAVISIGIAVSSEWGARPADAGAYLLGLGMAAPLLVRRRWPLAVLVAAFALLMAYYILNYPAFSPPLALAVPLYTAAAAGHLRVTLLLVGLLAAGSFLWRAFLDVVTEPLLPLLTDVIRDTSLLVAVVLLGEALRSRRAWAAEVRERLRRAEADREREAQRRVAAERLRIARELHDVMAHTVTVITVQAGVAADVLDDSPDDARGALRAIRAASREALEELRATVGVLREGEDGQGPAPLAPAPGLAQVDGLLDLAAQAGLATRLSRDGPSRPLPAAVDLAAFRILQESVTNVMRHASASTVAIGLRYEPDALVLSVDDDGRGPERGRGQAGHGLVGMRERAAAVGGRLDAERGPLGGFRVHARLPTRGAT